MSQPQKTKVAKTELRPSDLTPETNLTFLTKADVATVLAIAASKLKGIVRHCRSL
jgi:hypothetical protein